MLRGIVLFVPVYRVQLQETVNRQQFVKIDGTYVLACCFSALFCIDLTKMIWYNENREPCIAERITEIKRSRYNAQDRSA